MWWLNVLKFQRCIQPPHNVETQNKTIILKCNAAVTLPAAECDSSYFSRPYYHYCWIVLCLWIWNYL